MGREPDVLEQPQLPASTLLHRHPDWPVHTLFLQQARRLGDAVALESASSRIGYLQLARRVLKLGWYLAGIGVHDEAICAVALSSSFDFVTAALGTLVCGGAFAPLDPEYPPERLERMLEKLDARVLITRRDLADRFSAFPGERLFIDDEAIEAAPRLALPRVEPDALAYVVFTSGSTGEPNGILAAHRGIVNLAAAQIRDFGITRQSRVLQFASPSFDASISEIFCTLLAGATLYIPQPEERFPGTPLAKLLRSAAITTVTLPPSALALTSAEGLDCLATVVSAGEPCSAEIVAAWSPGRRFINAYGPSEVTVCATQGQCIPDGRRPGIGRAIDNTRVHILDERLAPVPVGSFGELYVAGPGLARGYTGRPDLTAERFIPDPFGPAGGRLFRTGDLARNRGDGLEFAGRVDRQIKIRGYRIEPAEVEAALRRDPRVRDALAISRPDHAGEPCLVAYAVVNANAAEPIDPSASIETELRDGVRRVLPEFMVPTAFVILDAWPVTPSGKIDHAALPPPRRRAFARGTVPVDPIELDIAAMWQELLGSPANVDEDFFAVGGHSLRAMALRNRIAARFGVELPVSAMVEAPTIARLAQLVRQARQPPAEEVVVALRRGNESQTPLFFAAPITGSATSYLGLAKRLDPTIPFYVLQAPGLDGQSAPCTTIEELARHHVRHVKRVQPTGPYRLGGWSFGGCVAFEMATQLWEQGDAVDVLALVDASFPDELLEDRARENLLDFDDASVAALYVKNLWRCQGVELSVSHDDFSAPTTMGVTRAVVARLRELGSSGIELATWHAWLQLFGVSLRAFLAYRPRGPYPGRVISFTGDQGHPEFARPVNDWSSVVSGPLEVCSVAGNHFTVVAEPHVDGLARSLERALNRPRISPPQELAPCGRVSGPVSRLQQFVLDCHRAGESENPLGKVRCAWVFDGKLDRELMVHCVQQFVARHWILRSRFDEVDGKDHQIFGADTDGLEPSFLDLGAIPAAALAPRLCGLAEEISRGLEPSGGRLTAAALVALERDRHALVVAIHHVAFDAGSASVLSRELQQSYRRLADGPAAPLPEPNLQYVDFTDYLERVAASPRGQRDRAYWRSQLAGVAPLALPVDFARDDLDAQRAAHPRGIALSAVGEAAAEVPPQVRADIAKLGCEERATPYMVLLAAFVGSLHRIADQDDIAVQSTYSFRGRPKLRSLIGFVGNALVLRVDVSGNPSFRELVRRTRAVVLSGWMHGEVPVFDSQLARVNFNYIPSGHMAFAEQQFARGLSARRVPVPVAAARALIPFDLHLWLVDSATCTRLRLFYSTRLFRPRTGEGFLARYTALLARAVRCSDKPLADLD